jgi:hypothetical protein
MNYFKNKTHRQWQSLKISMVFFGLALLVVLVAYPYCQDVVTYDDGKSAWTIFPESGMFSFFGTDSMYNIRKSQVRAIGYMADTTYVLYNTPSTCVKSIEKYTTLINRYNNIGE